MSEFGNNNPFESIKPRDISDEELRSIMGETAAKALIDEVNTAEDLDTVAEKDRPVESPSIEQMVAELDEANIDAEISELTDDNLEDWLNGDK